MSFYQGTSNSASFFTIQRCGGLASIGMALCYFTVALIFFVVLSQPEQAEPLQNIHYINQHQFLVLAGYAIGYLLFGFLLAVMVIAIPRQLPQPRSALVQASGLFGKVWVVLMMASGMIALTGLELVITLVNTDPDLAVTLFHAMGLMTHALGGGIELVGGLWILLFSLAGLQQQPQRAKLHGLGLLTGSFAILTVFHTQPYLKEAFGLSQLVWQLWFGVVLLRQSQMEVTAE
ncbi:MAG: hypothetical protein KJ556_17505 [Gammaproteobacteria bacterium]|nr:hypothetical protein [Gammaproteobacteria bacterium]MBU2058173.1 hypothetical protein [Gammaproteobacteria bacterium]MBU2176908.1 hypothetical protein [Gammaproteobacteria bacterium]MBU2245553.1 hypothetical protein [Gammaproteobacteria bacterium]MBU2342755.1 hypothetical protein [Gammaproteobacteria bacterium]